MNIEDINLEYLEGVSSSYVEDGGIYDASDSTPVIEDLEKIKSLPTQLLEKKLSRKVKKEHRFWEDMDIPLSDVVGHIFNISNRPIVIVRDDVVEYINPTAVKVLQLFNESQAIGEKFLNFVDKKDWDLLVTNISKMIADNQVVEIGLKTSVDRVYKTQLEAIYLPDSNHFSFILVGSPHIDALLQSKKMEVNNSHGLFDKLTGLPSFYLFEDRVQMSVNLESYKDVRQKKNIVAVVAIEIENLMDFEKIGIKDFILKKIASKLSQGVKKTSTVARGLKYSFWVLINDVVSDGELDLEISKIQALMSEPIVDNFNEHNLVFNIGVSKFPEPAKTAKKLIMQAMSAVATAIELEDKNIYIYQKDED